MWGFVIITKTCEICNKKYQTCHNKSRFCSRNCKSKFRRDQKLDHEIRVCLACGKEFSTNKYLDARYCSTKCGKSIAKVPKQQGYVLYFIKNRVNNKVYVGSTKDFKQRIRAHKNDLKLSKHKNSRLQGDHDLYGIEVFEFIVAEENIGKSQRYQKEQYCIDTFGLCNPNKGYNIAVDAKCGMKNRKHSKESIALMRMSHKNISDETRQKMSVWQKGRKRSAESVEKTVSRLRGKPRSEELKEKLSKLQSGSKSMHAKLSHDDVVDIRKRLDNNEKQKNIAKIFNVHPSVISKIAHNKRYKEDLL